MFDAGSASPFSLAAFQLLYDNWLTRITRAIIFVAGLTYFISTSVSLTDLTATHVNLVAFIWGLWVFWEGFYLLRLRTLNVGVPVGTRPNIGESFSSRAAKILLQAGSTDLSKIFAVTMRSSFAQFVLTKSNLTLKDLPNTSWGSWDEFLAALPEAVTAEGWSYVTEHDILAALARVPGPLKGALFNKDIKPEDLDGILFWAANEENRRQSYQFWNRQSLTKTKGIAQDWAYGYTLALDRYSHDITSDLSSGKVSRPYLVGKEAELDTIQKILSRSDKRNALLIGEAGVGKTTIIQLLAAKSLEGTTLPEIRFKRFLSLDLTSLLSGAGQGELEQRVKDLLADASRAGNIVLVIPNIEYLAGAGEGLVKIDLTGLILESLQGKKMQVIGLTDHAGYKNYLESHKELISSFELLEVAAASPASSIRIIEQLAPELERRHRTNLTYSAVKQSVDLSSRYLGDKELPGKAIELIDEAAVEASATSRKIVTGSDIENLVSRKTRIPVGRAKGPEKDKLLNLESLLHQRVIGQDEALAAVSNALRRSRAGLRDEKRPIGVFMFLGPTGVGKTETSKALAEIYFGDEKRMIRLDMSEYQTTADQVKLIGAPNQPGNLTDAVRQNPYSLVLLDEIEKAHPQILNTFLQVFDDGRLTDGLGRTVDFTNTIIIATSNAGAEQIRQIILSKQDLMSQRPELIDYLQRQDIFKPEFLNRFDEIVLFKPLSIEEIVLVVNLMLGSLDKRLATQDVKLIITPAAVTKIAESGFDPVFGARPLRRYIQDHVENLISRELLSGRIKRGSQVTIDAADLDANQLQTVSQQTQ